LTEVSKFHSDYFTDFELTVTRQCLHFSSE